ncbi:MAG: winged helix-turn-helix transcriptional regulator [bacterium]|nr:winged helix-turn-helix transcriptional regulator [bacterium]
MVTINDPIDRRKRHLEMAEYFKALGDAKRLKIIWMLSAKDDRLCVADLAEKLEITQPAASQHLRTLKNVGLVKPEREGNKVYYTLNIEKLVEYKEVSDFMYERVLEGCIYAAECDGICKFSETFKGHKT